MKAQTSCRHCLHDRILSQQQELGSRFLLVRLTAFLVVSTGDEVTMAYHHGLYKPMNERQDFLGGLGFACMCERCLLEASLPKFVSQDLQKVLHEMFKPGGVFEAMG